MKNWKKQLVEKTEREGGGTAAGYPFLFDPESDAGISYQPADD